MPFKVQTPLEKSRRHEREVARSFKGRLTAGSGNQSEKGDVRVKGKLRIECKSTENAGYNLTRETWQKIARAALAAGETPVMHIRFLSAGNVAEEIVCVPAWAFAEWQND